MKKKPVPSVWIDPDDAPPLTAENFRDGIWRIGDKEVTREAARTAIARLRGRPKAEATKERITIRLSPDVLARFRASGAGWQTRMDGALREWLKRHSPAA